MVDMVDVVGSSTPLDVRGGQKKKKKKMIF